MRQRTFDIEEINQKPFNVFDLNIDNTGTDFVNFPVKMVGRKLFVYRNDTTTKASQMLQVSFNSPSAKKFDLFPHSKFVIPFQKIYLHGETIIGRGNGQDVSLIAFSNENDIIEFPDLGSLRQQSFTSGSNVALFGQVIGVIISSFGNLVVQDYQGNTVTHSNLIPGEQYKLSFNYILSGTTCTGTVLYAY